MITVITGVPGAGKTLYAIEKLLVSLVGTTIKVPTDDGGEVEVPRTVYTNINGLLLEHELIETTGEWLQVGAAWEFKGNEASARNWHRWAKPGSVIVVDEFQKMWPPRPNGAKVPPDVQALDTHRHMGVDFILITQSVMNTDRHVHALGGRHLHVRRVANMKMAIVYEWDHVSRALQYSKSLTKAPWRYSSKIFKLYKSAEVHTKQPRKLPGLVWFLLVAVAVGTYMGPTFWQRMQDRLHPPPLVAVPPPAKHAANAPATAPAAPASTPSGEVVAAAMPAVSAPPAPVFSGCVSSAVRCLCYDSHGGQLEREPEACRMLTRPPTVVLAGGSFAEPEPARSVPRLPPSFTPQETGHGLEDLRRALRAEGYGR